jgi:ADP-ribosyl-[dinitrogen reductase] hydrolase
MSDISVDCRRFWSTGPVTDKRQAAAWLRLSASREKGNVDDEARGQISMTMMRTSHTHPLLIAEIQPASGFGRIGLTLCPGKTQKHGATGAWARDLDIDLDAIADWGAVAIVTLMEEHELHALKVDELGPRTIERNIAWYCLPIRDQGVPGEAFEAAWERTGEALRARLRDGFNILLHCMGGLGRTGTIAARLLIELGWEPQAAVAEVRKVRPGAIENATQLAHAMSRGGVAERYPEQSAPACRARAIGAMIGLAVGDAIGTTLEFRARDSFPPLGDMVGGGPFHLEVGQWTDDTSMALALMDSLLVKHGLDEADLMERFVRWHEEGEYSSTGRCFDIGITTRQALARWKKTGNPVAGATAPDTAGNGSLMRLAPVAIRYWQDRAQLCDVAARQSRTTHGAPEAVDACVAYAELLADAIEGCARSEVPRDRGGPWAGRIAGIMAGSWRGKHRDRIKATGYVAHSLEAALWCVGRTGSFAEAVLLAANLGEDADTTAAITGQLAGALYGVEGIPQRWRDMLAWGPFITETAGALFDAGADAPSGGSSDLQPLPARSQPS